MSGAALPLGWAATAHPFRAADSGSGAGSAVDRGVRPTTTARACGARRFLGAVLGRWTNRMIIETRPNARHSPFGAFQRPGCAVELRMGSFSADSTPALGRQLNRPTALVPAETHLFAVAIGRRDATCVRRA